MLMCDALPYNITTLLEKGEAMLNPDSSSPSHPQSIMNNLKTLLKQQIAELEDQILEILAFEVERQYLTWDINDLVERYHRIEDYIY
jgi:hypothetical protein